MFQLAGAVLVFLLATAWFVAGQWKKGSPISDHDPNDNLEVFPARSYDSQYSHWHSPDPAGLAAVDITNPQTWNRYAYVTNNPVSFTDPLGLFHMACFPGYPCDLVGGGGGGGDDSAGGPPCWMCGGPGGPGPNDYSGENGPGTPSGPLPGWAQWPGGYGGTGAIPGCGSDFLPCGATPPSLWDTLGLTPSCETDFGVCNPIGNGFGPGAIAIGASGRDLHNRRALRIGGTNCNRNRNGGCRLWPGNHPCSRLGYRPIQSVPKRSKGMRREIRAWPGQRRVL